MKSWIQQRGGAKKVLNCLSEGKNQAELWSSNVHRVRTTY